MTTTKKATIKKAPTHDNVYLCWDDLDNYVDICDKESDAKKYSFYIKAIIPKDQRKRSVCVGTVEIK